MRKCAIIINGYEEIQPGLQSAHELRRAGYRIQMFIFCPIQAKEKNGSDEVILHQIRSLGGKHISNRIENVVNSLIEFRSYSEMASLIKAADLVIPF